MPPGHGRYRRRHHWPQPWVLTQWAPPFVADPVVLAPAPDLDDADDAPPDDAASFAPTSADDADRAGPGDPAPAGEDEFRSRHGRRQLQGLVRTADGTLVGVPRDLLRQVALQAGGRASAPGRLGASALAAVTRNVTALLRRARLRPTRRPGSADTAVYVAPVVGGVVYFLTRTRTGTPPVLVGLRRVRAQPEQEAEYRSPRNSLDVRLSWLRRRIARVPRAGDVPSGGGVYVILDPQSGQPRYVGETKSFLQRWSGYYLDAFHLGVFADPANLPTELHRTVLFGVMPPQANVEHDRKTVEFALNRTLEQGGVVQSYTRPLRGRGVNPARTPALLRTDKSINPFRAVGPVVIRNLLPPEVHALLRKVPRYYDKASNILSVPGGSNYEVGV